METMLKYLVLAKMVYIVATFVQPGNTSGILPIPYFSALYRWLPKGYLSKLKKLAKFEYVTPNHSFIGIVKPEEMEPETKRNEKGVKIC